MLVGKVAPKSSRDRGHDLVREAAAQGLREAKQQHCAVELGLVVHYGCSAAAADVMADELIMTLSWPLTCPVEWD